MWPGAAFTPESSGALNAAHNMQRLEYKHIRNIDSTVANIGFTFLIKTTHRAGMDQLHGNRGIRLLTQLNLLINLLKSINNDQRKKSDSTK